MFKYEFFEENNVDKEKFKEKFEDFLNLSVDLSK